MDIKAIIEKMKEKWFVFWEWLKPYLIRFHEQRKRIWKKYQVNKVLLLLAMLSVLIVSIYLFYLAKQSDVKTLRDGLQRVTTVYDKDGDEAGTLRGATGTFVTLDEISPYVVDAVISTEDRRFYEHNGFDIRGILRSVFGILRTGGITGGGSTLTQQLAKNAYLDLDQTMVRKAKELFLAIEIEKQYSKDEILEMYLNHAYFANGVWGVEDASHRYFAKSAKDLTIDEAAVLAGMLKGPGIYNPIDYMDNAVARRDTVLQVMVDNGKLDQATCDQLKNEPLYTQDNYQEGDRGYQYPYYFDAVINEVERKTSIKVDDLLNKGYKVYTTMDQMHQQGMDTTFANDALFPPNAEDGEMVQGASIAIDPQTGGVRAVVGGRGEHTFRGLNRATQSSLSPGSTMKPLAVYTPALEAGYRPDSLLKDEALPFYDVENYDRVYRGEVTMYDALRESLNASTVWLYNEIGVERGAQKVEKFGIKLEKADFNYSLSLGGMTKGTTPMRMASAYTVFANQGRRKEPHFIRKIEDASGAVVYENEEAKSTAVTTRKIANEMTGMLRGVFSSGTGMAAQPYGYEMAGKTGTTESVYADSQSKDQWIIGYTPDVVLATWIGFDKSSETHYLTGTSGQVVSQIFKDEAQRILPHTAGTPFDADDIAAQNAQNPKDKIDRDKLMEDFEGKVKEGAEYWGGQVKEGAKYVRDRVSELWQDFQTNR
ncbi:PBP1A family penicillin-binding protein [Vagococcus lutrae]|uniref:PBP1A family penicillin-binding protein n=1 Tax=Vagococcus lutrae TaxID=81947 RepID=UPI00288FEA3E|nr:PBP1A family penicillin-binding protein [Vagococcus lutrae]MDT2807558.1 PBP1A family penicillin-binding protein [Vagococcus lutrae]